MEWDFTVIPYVLLLLKFFDLGIWAHKQDSNYNMLLTIICMIIALYSWFFAPILHRFIYKKIQAE